MTLPYLLSQVPNWFLVLFAAFSFGLAIYTIRSQNRQANAAVLDSMRKDIAEIQREQTRIQEQIKNMPNQGELAKILRDMEERLEKRLEKTLARFEEVARHFHCPYDGAGRG